MVHKHPFLAQLTDMYFEGAMEGRIHIGMQAAQSCQLGTVTHLHRNNQMCKTAGVQTAAPCPLVQGGGAGSNCESSDAGRGGAAWCYCTCTDTDVQSINTADGAKLSKRCPDPHCVGTGVLLDLGSNSLEERVALYFFAEDLEQKDLSAVTHSKLLGGIMEVKQQFNKIY